eukprot:1864405-Lingulodinium_polyedra.AAC.1
MAVPWGAGCTSTEDDASSSGSPSLGWSRSPQPCRAQATNSQVEQAVDEAHGGLTRAIPWQLLPRCDPIPCPSFLSGTPWWVRPLLDVDTGAQRGH